MRRMGRRKALLGVGSAIRVGPPEVHLVRILTPLPVLHRQPDFPGLEVEIERLNHLHSEGWDEPSGEVDAERLMRDKAVRGKVSI